MPYKSLGGGKFKGPSGKIFNTAQVKLYYANGGKFPHMRKKKNGKSKTNKNAKSSY